jgi:REP element-mobilizing transposase RayT
MPRANRYFIPGFVWHITHRCHKREFLLKFGHDRKRWLFWLFEAKKRYRLKILNYCITSNHIHLLVIDTGKDIIAKSMQLVAGRVAQEYNQRKNRSGAFWEDRYHATAIMKDTYLLQCMIYIDLNMVRVGIVKHPSDYSFCGYNEIISSPKRYALIDTNSLTRYCGFSKKASIIKTYKKWINNACSNTNHIKDSKWSESIAVGSNEFVTEISAKLGNRLKSREVKEENGIYHLKESTSSYTTNSSILINTSFDNTVYWNNNDVTNFNLNFY